MAAAEKVTVTVPLAPGPLTVVHGKEEWKVTRHDVARWLLGQQDTAGMSQQWIDMLGGLGLALKLESDGMIRMVISRPAAKMSVNHGRHYGGKYTDLTVTMCPLVWVLEWRNQKLAKGRLFASERPVRSLLDQAKLCYFPFGNVDTGGICWGSASTNHLSIKNPLEVETLFFRSGLNEHIYRGDWLGGRRGENQLADWVKNHGEDAVVPLDFTHERAYTLQQVLNLTDADRAGRAALGDEDDDLVEVAPEPEDEDDA